MKKKRWIPSHPALLIISVILAFFIWLGIMNVSDPITVRTISGIPIHFTNISYIESKGLSFETVDGYDKVSIRVSGNRSVVERLTNANVTATADLTQVVDFHSEPVMVPVSVTVPRVQSENITIIPSNVQIELEEMKSKDFVLNPTEEDTVPATGYEVGTMTANPEKITIRGSASLINKIDKVNAAVDVSGLSQDTDLGATIKIYDKNGDELSSSQTAFLTFNVDESKIKVHTVLYSVDSDVKVTAKTYGTPAKGYEAGDITLTPDTISVVGDAATLDAFRKAGNAIEITRGSEAINIKGASSDVSASVDIEQFLPDGIRLASGMSSTIVANVKILPYGSKAISLDVNTISKNNLGEGLNAVMTDPELDIRVQGASAALASLTPTQIHASVDLSGRKEGTYSVPVTITLPQGLSLVKQVQTNVTISKTTTVSDANKD